jgi:hypothetical protein
MDPATAHRQIRAILESGTVVWTQHARHELARDDMTTVDAENVLRAGVVEPAEWENGEWRYRVRTARMFVVVAFESETELVVVTAWRVRR